MDTRWLKRLSENTAEMTERLYINLLEDVEIFTGPLEDGVWTCVAGLPQLGVTIGQLAAKSVRRGMRRIFAHRGRNRQAWAWRHSSQLPS